MLSEKLKLHGYSLTKQRTAVLNALLESNQALSMGELKNLLADKLDRASLYRAIKIFEECGICIRINIGWKYKIELSDMFKPHHHHLYCTNCNQLIDIQDNYEIENIIEAVAKSYGFSPSHHTIEINGQCRACGNISQKNV